MQLIMFLIVTITVNY